MAKSKRRTSPLGLPGSLRNKSIVARSNGLKKSPKALKAQNTRKLIRRFHVLLKEKSQLQARFLSRQAAKEVLGVKNEKDIGKLIEKLSHSTKEQMDLPEALDEASKADITALVEIETEITRMGGLEVYQAASIQGQASTRGGDSSKILLQWLDVPKLKESLGSGRKDRKFILALEIGCLSSSNALSQSHIFSVCRIDLHSQEKEILQQDFMERPIPVSDVVDNTQPITTAYRGRFDMISCSLVLNFVPTAAGRGEMLKRTTRFLREPQSLAETFAGHSAVTGVFPSLFLVLPLPCVENSRYFNERRLTEIMESLGYEMLSSKKSNKLAYWLWRWKGRRYMVERVFKKKELFSKEESKGMNNFTVVLE